MLLGRNAHQKGWDVDHLFANSDVLLENENASVMDGVSEVTCLDLGLESSLKELSSGQTEDIIELAFVVFQETKSDHSADEGLTY